MYYDIITILGPTASGKTKYAVKMAYEIDAEIISADSRQLYRGMDIGTGKDLKEYNYKGKDIPYHLIDIVDAGEKYNIFQYQKDFEKVYADIKARGKKVILCGGSGLYIDAVTSAYQLIEVPPNPQLRAGLEQEDISTLIKRLEELKATDNCPDYDSKKRIIRAIEIAEYQKENSAISSSFSPKKSRFIGIELSKEERNTKIDKRLHDRIEEGLIKEVENLLLSGISAENLLYYGLEYKFVTMFLLGELSISQMEERLAIAIHQFAKRQMTWFRRMERKGATIEWVEPLK